VVAILDSGCGQHDWFDGVVTSGYGNIGYSDPWTDPELWGDLTGALDGVIDPLSGHGTFIAGLVRQGCPDADILSWRVIPSSGPVVESDWVHALEQIADLAERGRNGEDDARIIDVFSMSIGYYHESPDDLNFDPTLFHLLERIARTGTVVVCAAGNDATGEPNFPAGFAPYVHQGTVASPPNPYVTLDPAVPPIVSVGALNPNGSQAMFSNTGDWVSCYAEGAAVMSTFPAFEGGLLPVARSWANGVQRETIDPDDFRGGFGVWSGTSFSAPLMAARIAKRIQEHLDQGDDVSTATTRAFTAMEDLSIITP
jgi:hypothetical protein